MEERKLRTIIIEKDVHQDLKVYCVQKELKMKTVIEDLIKEYLEKNKK